MRTKLLAATLASGVILTGCATSLSSTIGKVLKPNDIVVYESTVYPGATEEVCVPVLEQYSGNHRYIQG